MMGNYLERIRSIAGKPAGLYVSATIYASAKREGSLPKKMFKAANKSMKVGDELEIFVDPELSTSDWYIVTR